MISPPQRKGGINLEISGDSSAIPPSGIGITLNKWISRSLPAFPNLIPTFTFVKKPLTPPSFMALTKNSSSRQEQGAEIIHAVQNRYENSIIHCFRGALQKHHPYKTYIFI